MTAVSSSILRRTSASLLIALFAAAAAAGSASAGGNSALPAQAKRVRERSEVQVRVLLARKLLEDGKAREAIDILKPLYREHAEEEAVWQLLVTAYLQAGVPERALALLERRMEREQQNVQHLKALGAIYMEMGDPEAAEDAWLRILEGGSEKGALYGEVADLLWDSGRYDRAIEVLREGAGYQRFYDSYMRDIVRREQLMGRNADAFRDELERLISQPGPGIRSADRLAGIFIEAGRDTALISAADSIAERSGNSTCRGLLIKSALHALAGDYRRGSALIGEADCRGPSEYIGFLSLLSLLERRESGSGMERFRAAAIDRFLSEFGDQRIAPRLLLQKAELMFRQGRRGNDSILIDRAFSLASQAQKHRYGQPYEDRGRILKARIELEGRANPGEAVSLLSGSKWRQRGLRKDGLTLLARAYSLCTECAGAEKELEKLSENGDPEVAAEALYRLSEFLLYTGRYEEAADKFAAAAKRAPSMDSSNDALDRAIMLKKGLRSGQSRALDLAARASLLEASGRPLSAADSLDLISECCPGSPLIPYAAIWSSSLKLSGGREEEVKITLAAVAENFPNSIYAPRALELLADIVSGEDRQKALQILETVMNRYPADPYLERIRKKSARIRREEAETDSAKEERM